MLYELPFSRSHQHLRRFQRFPSRVPPCCHLSPVGPESLPHHRHRKCARFSLSFFRDGKMKRGRLFYRSCRRGECDRVGETATQTSGQCPVSLGGSGEQRQEGSPQRCSPPEDADPPHSPPRPPCRPPAKRGSPAPPRPAEHAESATGWRGSERKDSGLTSDYKKSSRFCSR